MVANYILQLLDQDNGSTEIQRNELAGFLGCVPSQINYVITSRFTPEQGYLVESRRGGGGFIRITRVTMDPRSALIHIINSVGDSIDCASLKAMLNNMVQRGLLSASDARLIDAATWDRSLTAVPQEYRDKARAGIFKNTLITIMNHS